MSKKTIEISKFYIAILLVWIGSPALAQDVPVGTLMYSVVPPMPPADKYFEANGACLADSEYPILAETLHDGSNWPYGRCDADHFRLPDLTPKDKSRKTHIN